MTPEEVVQTFMKEVRSGRNLHLAPELMAEKVFAHQIQSEEEMTIERTPYEYAEHVQEMLNTYGKFTLKIDELLPSTDNRVYVRWKQFGTHIGEIDGFAPTGLPVIEYASAVYVVECKKIVEYWIQIDRMGIHHQLERNKEQSTSC